MVETEHTPNPDTLKFLPGKKVSEVGPVEFLKNDNGKKVPLADQILSLKGTKMVFFGEDFITVKKEKDLSWDDLKHSIISEINDYYSKLFCYNIYKQPKVNAVQQFYFIDTR